MLINEGGFRVTYDRKTKVFFIRNGEHFIELTKDQYFLILKEVLVETLTLKGIENV